jgi:hypothetical protein
MAQTSLLAVAAVVAQEKADQHANADSPTATNWFEISVDNPRRLQGLVALF